MTIPSKNLRDAVDMLNMLNDLVAKSIQLHKDIVEIIELDNRIRDDISKDIGILAKETRATITNCDSHLIATIQTVYRRVDDYFGRCVVVTARKLNPPPPPVIMDEGEEF